MAQNLARVERERIVKLHQFKAKLKYNMDWAKMERGKAAVKGLQRAYRRKVSGTHLRHLLSTPGSKKWVKTAVKVCAVVFIRLTHLICTKHPPITGERFD